MSKGSAQEPKMTAFLSQDPNMIKAYMEDKDLYAMIAQAAFGNNYEENLEFYKEFSEVQMDDKTIIAGSGKEYEIKIDESNSITVPFCYLLPTINGDVPADHITTSDIIKSDVGDLQITDIQNAVSVIINDIEVRQLKFSFKIS